MIMPVFVSSWMSILANTPCAGPPRASTLPLRILLVRLLLILSGCAVFTSPADAQITRTLTNTDEANFDGVFQGCGGPLVRTFVVTSNFIVGDVDLGVFITHTKRGNIRMTLQSPQGTRRQIVNDNSSINGDNFSVRLDDDAAQLVNTDGANTNHSTASVPPYQNNFRPNLSLSAFNGQQSNGTWTLEICDDDFFFDNGRFRRSDLYIRPATNARGTGATFVVTSTANTGNRTLRQAIVDANATPDADDIDFAISGAGPHTITLTSALPDITDNGVAINGTTQPGTQCRDLWLGNGHDLRINVRGAGFEGFQLNGSNQTIRGLSLTGFENAIRPLSGSSNAMIHCNYLGLLANGTSSGNNRGVRSLGAGMRIGGLDAGQGNVISANFIVGVVTEQGSTDSAIRGNFIGTDATGTTARANGSGINNFFGTATWRDITRNLISGNNGNGGIVLETDDRVSPSDGQIRIQSNIIGANRAQTAWLRNGGDGIYFDANSINNVLIGGTGSTEGNFITGNDDGIDLRSVSNITIRGNTITAAVARGINLNNVNTAEIGGATTGQGNRIGGNGTDAIYATNASSNITIFGNLIQPIATIGGTLANAGEGIWIDGASTVSIGNGTAQARNVIGGNRLRAIRVGQTNSNITIDGNYIGTDATGNVAVVNGQNAPANARDAIGVQFATVTNLVIRNNVIGGYTASLLETFGGTTTNTVIQNNSLGIGADGVSQIAPNTIEDLLFIGGSGNHTNMVIGGTSAGQGNIVAFGGRDGVRIDMSSGNLQLIGNTIRNNAADGIRMVGSGRAAMISNRIFANGLRGIDLGGNGVTANDPGDGDAGPNNLLNFPAITAVSVTSANQLIYSFTFDGPADGNGYRVEFFANSAADNSGFGEGETSLGHVDIVHGGGSQTYSGSIASLAPVSVGSVISATATRKTAGGAWDITSEFSATATAQGVAQLNVALTTEPYDPGSGAGFSTPGSDVSLTATVTNTGTGSTQSNTIFTVISINNASSFFNAETPAFGGVVRFTSTSPMLTFTPGTDMRFSNAATAPTEFAQCTYTPAAGYDPLVRFVCLNPKGSLPHSAPQNQFSVQLRARIN